MTLNRQRQEQQLVTVGHVIAVFLEAHEVKATFSVTSTHNMPIPDAVGERGKIRFVMAHGETSGANMADAYVRTIGGLGVCLTSIGTAAGNATGIMTEALTVGMPLLHVMGQIEAPYLDQNLAYIHEASDQLTMPKAVSRTAFRVRSTDTAISTMKLAAQTALTAPAGPVSVEIPVDIQAALIPMSGDPCPLLVSQYVLPAHALDELAEHLSRARRPMLWLGGGARHAAKQIKRLMDLGFGVVTSMQGRGTVPEGDLRSLGAFNLYKPVEAFCQTCDAMAMISSCLRGNETLKCELKLPRPLYRIDADASTEGRCYASDYFVCGDPTSTPDGLVDQPEKRMQIDMIFVTDLQAVYEAAAGGLIGGLGSYVKLVEVLQAAVGREFNWVRDMTVPNSTWGNRQPRIFDSRAGVHVLGGGIGQGLAVGIDAVIGAATTGSGKTTFCLVGDGGLILNLGELITAVQERANLVIVLVDDKGHGVIKNIQDAQYGGCRHYVDLHTSDHATFVQSLQPRHRRVSDLVNVGSALKGAASGEGPFLMEIDMLFIGSFKTIFAGPPVNQQTKNGRGECVAARATDSATVIV